MDPQEIEDELAEPIDDPKAAAAVEFIEDILDAMESLSNVEWEQTGDGCYTIEVVGEDAGDLIGRYGSGLNALQYLTGLVVQRRTGEHARITLDADGYRGKREAALVQQAKNLAAEVAAAGQEAELDPLSAFERRIIHNALMDHPDVVTYSEGEEPDRRVIIAPRPS